MAKLIVVSGPSGVGKSTVIQKVLKTEPTWQRVITVTTRAPRSQERNGTDYLFLTKTAFKKMLKNKQLAEWAKVYGHYYGIPKRSLDEGLKENKILLVNADYQGLKRLKKIYRRQVLSVWINAEWPDKLFSRLKRRTTASPAETARRLKALQKELTRAKDYDYQVTNYEGQPNRAARLLLTIIRRAARIRR